MNVLFVGAHPDDIETFAGGTAARYKARGDKLFFCVATNGNVGSSTLPPDEIAAIRHEEAKAGAAVLGAELIWLDFDDEFLLDSRESRLAFINAFRIARPDVVFCHWQNDYNPDHSISGYLVDECVSMACIPNIRTDEPPTDKIPHVYYMDTPAGVNFEPELYVDITGTFSVKVEMVGKHESQDQWMKDLFGYELEAFLEIPAKFRGLQAGVKMAEAFKPSQRWGRTFTQHLLPDCLEAVKV
ncbi:MAG: PIG-L family deacetylase [Candidatus Latescibacteria bacterium]|jgi:LmbE family N-acetylglucosaminyl deacetylase|nr:PIG-L family deacetylase [Candidatus Latescibacterota bacterium]